MILNFQSLILNHPILTTILTTIFCLLSIVLIILKIKYQKLKIKYQKLQEKLQQDRTNKFDKAFTEYQLLVEKLDKKITAYANYLIVDRKRLRNKEKEQQDLTSLFDYRLQHYTEEKQKICKLVLHHIVNMYKKFEKNEQRTHFIILIDSGSTVYPFFNLISSVAKDEYYEKFIRHCTLFTNNIPGIQRLIKDARIGPFYNSEMMIECNVIPGIVEGKYSAILGPDSGGHLCHVIESFKKNMEDKKVTVKVISLITGNYISIPNGVLWRGKYHGTLKNYLIYLADYVYILSPLGKIFDKTAEEINNLIKSSDYLLPPQKEYKNLIHKEALDDNLNKVFHEDINLFLPRYKDSNKTIYLVTTKRDIQNPSIYPVNLHTYFTSIFTKIQSIFEDKLLYVKFEPWVESEQVIIDLLIYRQKNTAFLNYEFPHPEIREEIKKEIAVSSSAALHGGR